MKVFQGRRLGAIEDFTIEERASVPPGPGQIRVHVEATALGW